jgi:6-phosphogluconolactonase
MMDIEVFSDAGVVARQAAKLIAKEARDSVSVRGKFVMAVSGGKTPWIMLRNLGQEDMPWNSVHVVQVDERIAAPGDPDRNLTHLRESLLASAPLHPEQLHAMPVESCNFESVCTRYALALEKIAGSPPVLDLVHLGLGPDGHTASLVPADPVLEVQDADVALTGTVYQGHRRMTLTYPIINRSRFVLWLFTGEEKSPMLPRLLAGDVSIPAGRVRANRAVILADQAAASEVDKKSRVEVA